MTSAWTQVENESHDAPPESVEDQPDQRRHPWMVPGLIFLALAVMFLIFFVIGPALAEQPAGGCGGG